MSNVTDVEMAHIWKIKAKYGDAFGFNPQGIQVSAAHPGQPVRPGVPNQPAKPTTYNNVVFSWQNQKGLEVVHEVVTYLLRVEEKAEAAA
jgi:hypothetical protein